MKKDIRNLFIIVLVGIIIFSVYKMLIKDFTVTYNVNKYKVVEHFYINEKQYYDFTITQGKQKYLYTLSENLNKKKKIISKINVYKSNNLVCIVPIYKKHIKKNLYCNLNRNQVSNNYLLKSNNEDFKKILSKSKVNINTESTTKNVYKRLNIYNKNLHDVIYYIWDYKGLYIVEKDNPRYQKVLNYDLYDNVESTVVDKYYVLFENSSVNGVKNIYYYDTRTDKLRKHKLHKKLDKDSYINGVIGDLIYVTDIEDKKEYTFDVRTGKTKEVNAGNGEYITYDNGIIKKMSKSDFFMKKQFFSNTLVKDKEIPNTGELKRSNNNYYLLENNKLYRIREDDKKHKMLLLELGDIVDWQIIDDKLIILREDMLYEYCDQFGLRKIIKYNELKYNYKNIYTIGRR